MFCQTCGAEINDNAVICVKCGAMVNRPSGGKSNTFFEDSEIKGNYSIMPCCQTASLTVGCARTDD